MNRKDLLIRFAVGFAAKLAANLLSDEIRRRRNEKAPDPEHRPRHMKKEA